MVVTNGKLEYHLIAEASAGGATSQLRMSPRHSTEPAIWTAPCDILSYRCAPAASVWSRPPGSGRDFRSDGLLTFRPRAASWEVMTDGLPQVSVVTRFDRPLKYPGSGSLEALDVSDPATFALMRMLLDELRDPGFSSAALVESIVTALRVKLRRLVQPKAVPPSQDHMLEPDQISLMREFILSYRGRAPTVTELADLCQLSPRTLLRMFRNRTGMTVAGYIAQIQMDRAKALLTNSNLMIKRVAFEIGFGDPNHFCNAFKRVTGFSPSEFRTLARH